jgi:hypothetical protein
MESEGGGKVRFDQFYNDAVNEELFKHGEDPAMMRSEHRRWAAGHTTFEASQHFQCYAALHLKPSPLSSSRD